MQRDFRIIACIVMMIDMRFLDVFSGRTVNLTSGHLFSDTNFAAKVLE